MQITMEKITPAKATTWLNKNTRNRKMRAGLAEKYAADMKAGRWTECPVPISFCDDGALADGQHRLWAIIEADVTLTMPVARGLTQEDMLNIDTGRSRTLVDNAKISGMNTSLSNELLAVVQAVEDGMRQPAGPKNKKQRSNAERMDLVEKHGDAAAWAITNGPKGQGRRNKLTLAAVARAWYVEEDKERLRRFCDVFTSGMPGSDSELAAVALRNYFLLKGPAVSTEGMWRDTFLKAQNAIYYFMRGKKLTTIKKVADEMYPLKAKSKAKK